ncbi:MAG: tetratricopeptide repeat protein [Cyclobacteriaceae bacterium]
MKGGDRKNGIQLHTLLLVFLFSGCLSLNAQSYFEEAESNFTKRYEKLVGTYANKYYVNLAIRGYKKSNKNPEVVAALLRAYEFKATYTKLPKVTKRKILKKAVSMGREAMRDYPESIPIKYYYMANLGRWGQTISITTAAQEGILKEIKTLDNEIIDADSTFDEAGPLRILGAMHLKVPTIPFILSWPSDEEALRLLHSAYSIAPSNVGNALFYAEALIENNKEEEARILLEDIANRKPRKIRFLEDLKNINDAKQLLEDNHL